LDVKNFARNYIRFIRQPDVARLLVVAFLSRMPIGMVGFAMVMFLRESLGNFALAGSAVGINFVAMAAVAPIVGRLIDRFGPRVPLVVTGIVQPLALAAVLVSAKLQLSFTVVAAAAATAGMFASPITTLTRTAWRYRFDREEDRRTAFALDAVMIELNFTVGPAIVAAILATAGATAAFATSLVAVVAAFFIFLTSPALRYFKRDRSTRRHLLGPLTEKQLWIVFLVTFGLAASLGLIEVGYPAFATWLAVPALAGIFLSVNSIGSALGGAVFGGFHLRMPVERQLAAAMGLMAIPLFLHGVVATATPFAVVAFFCGTLIAPSIACQSVLVSRLAPSQYATEAFTWSSTFIVSGLGAGMALGGWLVETHGVRSAFFTGSAILGAVALIALAISPPVERGVAARAAD
jgi:MFS family permease